MPAQGKLPDTPQCPWVAPEEITEFVFNPTAPRTPDWGVRMISTTIFANARPII